MLIVPYIYAFNGVGYTVISTYLLMMHKVGPNSGKGKLYYLLKQLSEIVWESFESSR